jgi:hypothetical protein
MKSLQKTCDANKRLPMGRKQGRSSFRVAGQAHRANFQMKPDRGCAGKQTFVEDFTGEHSLPGLHVPLIGIAGSF